MFLHGRQPTCPGLIRITYCSHRSTSDGLNGQALFLICLQLVFQGTWCSTGTKEALPVDHTPTIKSVRVFKNIKSVSVSSMSETTHLYLGFQAPFIDIPSTVFSNLNRAIFQQGEYNLNKKHIIITEKHTVYVHLYSLVLTTLFPTTFIGI